MFLLIKPKIAVTTHSPPLTPARLRIRPKWGECVISKYLSEKLSPLASMTRFLETDFTGRSRSSCST